MNQPRTDVWSRSRGISHSLTERGYYAAIGVFVLFGIGVATVSGTAAASIWTTSSWSSLLLIFLAMGAMTVQLRARTVGMSLMAYVVVAAAMGAAVGPMVAFISVRSPGALGEAVMLTGLATAIMTCAAIVWPTLALSMGRFLMVSLIATIVAQVAMAILPVFGVGVQASAWRMMDFIVAAIFCGYIAYDFARASTLERSLMTASSVAAALFVDILNLFLRILSIVGNRR